MVKLIVHPTPYEDPFFTYIWAAWSLRLLFCNIVQPCRTLHERLDTAANFNSHAMKHRQVCDSPLDFPFLHTWLPWSHSKSTCSSAPWHTRSFQPKFKVARHIILVIAFKMFDAKTAPHAVRFVQRDFRHWQATCDSSTTSVVWRPFLNLEPRFFNLSWTFPIEIWSGSELLFKVFSQFLKWANSFSRLNSKRNSVRFLIALLFQRENTVCEGIDSIRLGNFLFVHWDQRSTASRDPHKTLAKMSRGIMNI